LNYPKGQVEFDPHFTFLNDMRSLVRTASGAGLLMSDASGILRALPLPAVLIGPDARIAFANEAAEAWLGRAIAGRHYLTILRQPTLVEAVDAALRDGQTSQISYVTSQASRDVTFRTTAAPLALAAGQGVLLSFEDITPLQEAGQIRRDFVANVSHELRTPLTALVGFIETLKGAARDDAAARERFLTIMEREAGRMNRLVQDLLSLSRVEAAERMRPTDPVDIGRVALMVIATLRPLAAAHDMRLETDGLDTGELVQGDADQLAQVFTNLIENALKYGRRGGVVRVALERRGHEPMLRGPAVVVAVIDDGDGVDAVHIARLTERFYRLRQRSLLASSRCLRPRPCGRSLTISTPASFRGLFDGDVGVHDELLAQKRVLFENFFIRPGMMLLWITASGFGLAAARSLPAPFASGPDRSRSRTAGSSVASDSDKGLVAAICMAICLPMPLSAPFQRDQNTDLAHAIGGGVVDIGRHGITLDRGHAAQRHVLADGWRWRRSAVSTGLPATWARPSAPQGRHIQRGAGDLRDQRLGNRRSWRRNRFPS
jgi:two-component system, OmpR family, phosphate regulon sensor histidine kinase PhoR